MTRGEVWWADFGIPSGSEPGYSRPAVILSSDRFNRSQIRTVIVCAVTSNLRWATAPGNVELDLGAAGLPKPSVINVSHTRVVDRSRLVESTGSLDEAAMKKVNEGLRLVLGI